MSGINIKKAVPIPEKKMDSLPAHKKLSFGTETAVKLNDDIPESTTKNSPEYSPVGTSEEKKTNVVNEESESEQPSINTNVGNVIYGKVKDIWIWGKNVPIVSSVLGIAEGVTGKLIDVTTGQSLESVDHAITNQIVFLDDKLFNPFIDKFVQIFMAMSEKVFLKTTSENP